VVTASYDYTARVWDASTGKELTLLNGNTSAVQTAAFSADGRRVVTASDDGTARVWDAGTGKLLLTLRDHTGTVRTARFSNDGTRILITVLTVKDGT
jgi:WD40 repeat protein